MGMQSGITIGDKHTYNDFNLLMSSYYIPEPEPKVQKIDIPFSSGSIDVTDITGVTPYNDRDGLEFVFGLKDGSHEAWAIAVRNISMYLHGQKMKMILDYDPQYYYMVRLQVNPEKTSRTTGQITLSGSAEPFKYALLASNEPWKWDPFSFVDGHITETTSDITVSGTKNITIYAGGVLTSPTFYVYESTNLTVTFDDTVYKLDKPNTAKAYEVYRFPQLKVGNTDSILTFNGVGKVSVEYRGRFL